jgi:hypothetical protein
MVSRSPDRAAVVRQAAARKKLKRIQTARLLSQTGGFAWAKRSACKNRE